MNLDHMILLLPQFQRADSDLTTIDFTLKEKKESISQSDGNK